MKDILEEIVAHKRLEVERAKAIVPPRRLYALAEEAVLRGRPAISMKSALADSETGVIAEFKRRSPSKGWINAEASPSSVVPEYEANGAAAISILTDGHYFGGSDRDVREARALTGLPILRKDFVVDEYQLFEARTMGADAVLLIAACLDRRLCSALAARAHELGLEVLLETHSRGELDYVDGETDMVGVNNRHLGTFHTDVQTSFELAPLLPEGKVLVSESGIADADVMRRLRQAGYRGFLIGESLMRESRPGEALGRLTGGGA